MEQGATGQEGVLYLVLEDLEMLRKIAQALTAEAEVRIPPPSAVVFLRDVPAEAEPEAWEVFLPAWETLRRCWHWTRELPTSSALEKMLAELGLVPLAHNFQVCQDCAYKERCTKSKKGRSIFRHVDQDFLDSIDAHTKASKDRYSLRALIAEHPFGTIKRNWNAYYFITRGQCSVSAEMALSFLAYNLKRAIKVLGVKEILRRLREKGEPAPV